MSDPVKIWDKRINGRLFAVGDLHGCYNLLMTRLGQVGFDFDNDLLVSVGDLVDRGPECRQVLEWLAKPWFHPVRGNHDDYVCRFDTCDVENWVYNGGAWFAGLAWDEQREFAAQFNELPIAIEVDTPAGLVGLVHADCPFPSWFQLQFALTAQLTPKELKLVKNTCMWSRSRIEQGDTTGVLDIHAVICGHTPLRKPVLLGNVYHIDTAGWLPDGSGYFTLLNLGTLEAIPDIPQKLEWGAA